MADISNFKLKISNFMQGLAIKVENVSKTFRIPHEKITTIRGAFVSTRMAKIDFQNTFKYT